MAGPRVAVVVTCWNLGAYLPETIRSIRAQTFTDYEICVVDDGSTDPATLEVLGRLPADIRRVTTENRGLPAARNAGLRATSGEYVCAVDADDILSPSLLEKSVERLNASPTLAFVSHWLRAFGDESWELRPAQCDLPGLLDTNPVNGAALIRRSVVAAVGGWDETMRDGGEDWEFWIRVVSGGYRGEIIPEVLFEYRRRADSMSRIKFAGSGHAAVYRSIIERHPSLFRQHWPSLAARREGDMAGHRADTDRLEALIELELEPATHRTRDDLETVRHQADRADREAALQSEREHLATSASALERDNDALLAQVAHAAQSLEESASRMRDIESSQRRLQDELTSLTQAHGHAVQSIDALHSSWSWRLSYPLRVLGRLALQLRSYAPRR